MNKSRLVYKNEFIMNENYKNEFIMSESERAQALLDSSIAYIRSLIQLTDNIPTPTSTLGKRAIEVTKYGMQRLLDDLLELEVSIY